MAPEIPDGQHDRCLQKTDVSIKEFAKFTAPIVRARNTLKHLPPEVLF